MKNLVIVTRHKGLVEFLAKDLGITGKVITHATQETVQGKDVIGVLPHSLSCLTTSFSEIPLSIPAELRGKELNYDEVKKYSSQMVTYIVTKRRTPK